MPAQRHFASHRLFVGLVVGLSWVVAVEYFFGYVIARNESHDDAGQSLAMAGSWLAVGVFLLLGEFLLSRARKRDVTPHAAGKEPFPVLTARAKPDFE